LKYLGVDGRIILKWILKEIEREVVDWMQLVQVTVLWKR